MSESGCVSAALESEIPVGVFPETMESSREVSTTGIAGPSDCAKSVSRVGKSIVYVAETRCTQVLHLMIPTKIAKKAEPAVDHYCFQTNLYIHRRPKRYPRVMNLESGHGGLLEPRHELGKR